MAIETEIGAAMIGLVTGIVVEWVRARSSRTVATMQIADNREQRLREAADALIDDYRDRLEMALADLERLERARSGLERRLREMGRRRAHYHARPTSGGR